MDDRWLHSLCLGLTLTLAAAWSGCGNLSDEQRGQIVMAATFAAMAGIAEGVENKRVRGTARDAAAIAWSCHPDRVHARIRSEHNGTHIVSVDGCGRSATFHCIRRDCWELAPPGTYSIPQL